MPIVKLLAVVSVIGSALWFYAQPDHEPALAIVGSISALITVLFVERRKRATELQKQTVGTGGIGVQAGGDVSIGTLRSSGKGDSNVQ